MEDENGRHAEAVEKRRKREEQKEQVKAEFFNVKFQGTGTYMLRSVLGQGAYGVVCAADHSVTGERVAIKRIRSVMNSPAMATRILRELKFLRLLREHENIIKIRDVLVPGERELFNDTFVVFEIMPTDLSRLLSSRTELKKEHVEYFMFQLLRAVHFMHSAHVFHRDLKPSNILINRQCELRVCDFGLARAMFENTDEMVYWTDYVATRWYRAPELIMSYFGNYSTAIDMWSVGCIFAEMLNGGRPLFPGRNQYNQFELITEVTGRPNPEAIERLRSEEARKYVAQIPTRPRRPLETIFKPGTDPVALDLLSRMLEFDPERRFSALEALNHDYFTKYRHLGLGAEAVPISPEHFEFERRVGMTPELMRLEFMKEIAYYHPEELQDVVGGNFGYSEAGQFGQQMDASMRGDHRLAARTLPEEGLQQLNARHGVQYRASTLTEDKLKKLNQGPGTRDI